MPDADDAANGVPAGVSGIWNVLLRTIGCPLPHVGPARSGRVSELRDRLGLRLLATGLQSHQHASRPRRSLLVPCPQRAGASEARSCAALRPRSSTCVEILVCSGL